MPGRRSNTAPGGQPPKHLPTVHLNLGHAPAFSPSIDVSASPDSRVEPLTAPSSPSVTLQDENSKELHYLTCWCGLWFRFQYWFKPNSATSG